METSQKASRSLMHVRSFEKALQGYTGKIPLARFLTQFFKENKQMGSRDRKNVSRLLYHYFRIGNAASKEPILKRLAISEILAGGDPQLVEALTPQLHPLCEVSLERKIDGLVAQTSFRIEDVFPCVASLSPEIDTTLFLKSFFGQPNLFIRTKKNHTPAILKALEDSQVSYQLVSPKTLAFENGTSLQQLDLPKGSYQVQDLSSQRVLSDIETASNASWWDACSGSGGKSLNLLDQFPNLRLLVTDVRPSILRNLAERFEEAGITSYRAKVLDLTKGTELLGDERFDGIILDVPCSGSGTWGRTPEQLSQFHSSRITFFSSLQREIAGRALPHLAEHGSLYYITCSVFAQENEAVIEYLTAHHPLEVIRIRYEKGYAYQADTLFVAQLKWKKK